MDMRDKIAEIVRDSMSLYPDMYDYQVAADAIMAEMPAMLMDMIPDLVWRDSYGVWRAETPFGNYSVAVSGRILNLPLPMTPQQVHDSDEAAKAAANAHHRKQLLKAMGLD